MEVKFAIYLLHLFVVKSVGILHLFVVKNVEIVHLFVVKSVIRIQKFVDKSALTGYNIHYIMMQKLDVSFVSYFCILMSKEAFLCIELLLRNY